MGVGERIKQLRKQKYTQEKLAEVIGVHINTIVRWERGDRIPSIDNLGALAIALNTTVAYLSGETDNPERATSTSREPELQQAEAQTETRYKGDLYYKFPDGGELSLPATPDGYKLFREMTDKIMRGGISAAGQV